MKKSIEIVCHKGANAHAPENTFASSQLCIDWGMDYVEIDVNTSQDGVLYLLHGPDVERTTNGKGLISELSSADIDSLDAGSWFSPKFAGEPVPRLESFLKRIKGKIKVFFDVKYPVEPQQVIAMVYQAGLERECFFWFERHTEALKFRKLDRQLLLKVNVRSVKEAALAKDELGANIVEIGLDDMNQELLQACRQIGLKVMINYMGNDPEAFRKILRWQVDMVNVDYGDEFVRALQLFES